MTDELKASLRSSLRTSGRTQRRGLRLGAGLVQRNDQQTPAPDSPLCRCPDGPGLGSCDDGLVIDLSMMKSVRVDPANRSVRHIRHKIANPTEILSCTPPVDRIEGTVPVHKAVPAPGPRVGDDHRTSGRARCRVGSCRSDRRRPNPLVRASRRLAPVPGTPRPARWAAPARVRRSSGRRQTGAGPGPG